MYMYSDSSASSYHFMGSIFQVSCTMLIQYYSNTHVCVSSLPFFSDVMEISLDRFLEHKLFVRFAYNKYVHELVILMASLLG